MVDERAGESEPDADFYLAVLVRKWMTLKQSAEPQSPPGGDEQRTEAQSPPPTESLAEMAKDPSLFLTYAQRLDPVIDAAAAPPALPRPGLPPHPASATPRLTRRLAVLINAETTTAESADVLFEVLADYGTTTVCRAYADWTSPATRLWSSPLRQHGIQPHHHFSEAGDQRALVALTIDAIELARESAVDVVAIIGDLASLHPLVVHLKTLGLQVIAFGTTRTPADVQALCHEFIAVASLTDPGVARIGRHRA